MDTDNQDIKKTSGILETVMSSQTAEALRNFDPQAQVLRFLEKLPAREHQIIASRYGLLADPPLTLEHIGQQTNLTRERVRQIEKAVIRRLQNQEMSGDFLTGVDLIFQTLEEHGNIMREDRLLEQLLPEQHGKNALAANAVLFILNFVPRFNLLKETDALHRAWCLSGFDREMFDSILRTATETFTEGEAVLPTKVFFKQLRDKITVAGAGTNLAEPALESMISISRTIDKNPFEEWGLLSWPQIRPHDVGDKAYLVLQHDGKPAHYSAITELINKHLFDKRRAHKETVHNELIKDKRFVLVGRGIYALTEWGYRPGVVADIITEILQKSGAPLNKEEIIEAVGKQRLVKRNTVIVGLSNRQRFKKTTDNKYTNA